MIVEKLNQLLEIFAILNIIHFLYGKKIKLNYKMSLTVCSDLLICELINTYSVPWIAIFGQYMILLTYCIYTFHVTVREYIVNSTLAVVFISIIQMLAMLPFALLNIGTTITHWHMVIMNIFSLFLIFIFDRRVGFEKIKKYVLEHELLTKVVIILCLVGISSMLIRQKATKAIVDIWYIGLVIFGTIICVLWYQWIVQRQQAQEKERDLQVYHLYYDAYQELIQELRFRQHDYNNHIQAILSQHYVCKDYDTLVCAQNDYIKDMAIEDRFSDLLKTNHSLLSGFLYSKFQEAYRKKILVDYEIHLPDKIEGVPQYVLIETFGILLDNAIEAIEMRPKPEKILEIRAFKESSKVIFCVTNQIEWKQNSEITSMFAVGISSKGSMRGLGLSKLKQYARKYKWDIVVTTNTKKDKTYLTIKIQFNDNCKPAIL